MTTTELVTDGLATHRLTRLVTTDTITEHWRLVVKYRGPEWAAKLVDCRWCAGWWCSIAIVIARMVCPRLWAPIARALAFSSVAGLLAAGEQD